jgi:hypothetical protein
MNRSASPARLLARAQAERLLQELSQLRVPGILAKNSTRRDCVKQSALDKNVEASTKLLDASSESSPFFAQITREA